MLRISKKADYAVFLLGAIARQGAYPGGSASGDAVVSAHEISKLAGLNKSVVANLLKDFARHGVLESTRGLKGGYRLARPPADVSLGEILEVVEGRFTLVECIGGHGDAANHSLLPQSAAPTATAKSHTCSLISFCPSKNPMRVVHERILQMFRQIRLDELCSMNAVASSANPKSPAPVGSAR